MIVILCKTATRHEPMELPHQMKNMILKMDLEGERHVLEQTK